MEYPSTAEGNFGFGLNDVDFSDRVLCLEIMPALASNMNSGGEKYLNWFPSLDANDSECGSVFKVKKVHISSLVLASKSLFFYKLFKNGMKESQQRNDVTLRINVAEEAAFMDLLNFMYGNPLNATTTPELVDVLTAADKFEVTLCMQYCIGSLLEVPMSMESALLCLELPSSVTVAKVIKPLIDAAKKYLASYFRDFNESQQKAAMNLPLSALEVVLSSDGLKVDSEDDVFEFILKWARLHYPKLEERRDFLTKPLSEFICFAHMSSWKLKEVVDCPNLDYKQVSKLVLNSLISKDQVLHTTKCGFPRRDYKYRLIKVVQLEFFRPRCFVYLDLKKEECADLYPSNVLCSQAFCLGGRDFFLSAYCHQKQPNSVHQFGLFVHMNGSENCTLTYAFAVMKKPMMEFQIQGTYNYTLTVKEKAMGAWLFDWTDLMRDQSVYFINGILHVQVQLTINN